MTGLVQPDGTPYAACVGIPVVGLNSLDDVPSTYTRGCRWRRWRRWTGRRWRAGRYGGSGEVAGFPVCGEDTLFVYGYAKEWASEAVTIGVADRRQQ